MKTTMEKTKDRGVFKLADGKFRLRITATCPRTGKPLEATRTLPTGTPRSELLRELVALKDGLLRANEAPQSEQLSVSDYCERWLEAKGKRLRPGVAERYVDVLDRHILPHIGQLRLDRVTRRDVEDWAAWAEKACKPSGAVYSGQTLLTWWRLMCQVLKDVAAEFGLIDPTLRVRAPDRRSPSCREQRTLGPEQFHRFLDEARQSAPDRFAEIATLAMTGMRAGEVYGLQWSDIDEVRGVLRIQRSASHGHVTLTKTGDPREVALPDGLRDLLRAHRRHLVETQHRGLASGIVFPADHGGHRIPQSLHKVTKELAKKCGIDVLVGPQVLRRTFNTLMLRAGVDGVTLRAMMGHTTEAMTQRYAGVPVDQKQEAVARLLRKPESAGDKRS